MAPVFYATVDADSIRPSMPAGVRVLLPATSFARRGFPTPRLPSQIHEAAADSGGFVAMRRGGYPFRIHQYAAWLSRWRPRWAVIPDFPCLDADTREVQRRQRIGAELAAYTWETYGWAPWAWCPVIQGRSPSDYRRHARSLAPLIRAMQHTYFALEPDDGNDEEDRRWRDFRVGVGSLKAQPSGRHVHAVVQEIQAELPGAPLHLFGVALRLLGDHVALPEAVVSLDSAAWNGRFARGIEEARRSGMRQRDYAYRIAAPRYLAKIERALARPKQPMLC